MTAQTDITEQSLNISGKGHTVASIGGDVEGDVILTTTTIRQDKLEFVSIPLEQFHPPRFPSPRNITQLTNILSQHHLLVLGGNNELDKDDLARHVAWYWREMLEQEASADATPPPALEWRRTSDPQSLNVTLRTTTESTIFILPQIEPQEVRYNLSSIQNAAAKRQHYVLISTDKPFASWKQDDNVRDTFWYELPGPDLWDPTDLADALIETLLDTQETLPAGLLDKEPAPTRTFVGKLLFKDVAERLCTPGNLTGFVRLLRTETALPSESRILDLIERARGDEYTLKHWYHTQLEKREQLLALGLGLLDGLFDDQLFAALEDLTRQVWQQRDPFLSALDYNDLDNLGNFFKSFEPQGIQFYGNDRADSVYLPKIEIRSPELRQRLLAVAWQSHRRRILSTLPMLTQFARNSAIGRSFDTELYGSRMRRDQLRRVISKALLEIGLISLRAVEGELIQLAADKEMIVQAVAASAMAQWRDYGRDQELFEMLRRWQHETRIIDLIDTILKGRDAQAAEEDAESSSPQAYIRATVALTVSYAAQYDRPNELSEELCDLLQDIAQDPTRLVHDRFCNHTLRWVVPLHLEQLHGFLRDLVMDTPDYAPAVAISLAHAYAENPDTVVTTLDRWIEERPFGESKAGITRREALLVTVARTYGYIHYDAGIGPLTIETAFEQLKSFLADEKQPFVREAVIDAIIYQMDYNLEQVAPLLPDLLEEITSKERDRIVQTLNKIYLQQRKNLQGGDQIVTIEGQQYPAWTYAQRRPKTNVEETLFRWLQDDQHMLAQQVAAQALVTFADQLDLKEQAVIETLQALRQVRERVRRQQPTLPSPTRTGEVRKPSLFQRLAARLATMGAAGRYYSVICGLLPEVLVHRRSNRETMRFVLNQWQEDRDDEIRAIGARVARAVGLTGLVSTLGCLILIFIILILIVIGSSL
jgi:hypothetical protein